MGCTVDSPMKVRSIEERLLKLFSERLKIQIKNEDKGVLLLGSKIGLTALDLVYICLDIEKEFGIAIDDYCIETYSLTTFNNINEFIVSSL